VERKDYKKFELNRSDLISNPILQFKKWFEEAEKTENQEANAMTLSTATSDGIPSARIVLLKEINKDGFIFYTNYNSRKGKELEDNSYAALTFWWPELERQVRIEGKVLKTSEKTSDKYFHSRPVKSQIGASTSPQSQVIEDRTSLEHDFHQLELEAKDSKLERPENWGGYIVLPTFIEFWQGRASRLHDRFRYSLVKDNKWIINRLAP
jgi:pyridoxamine 5'-phosphate oxidase